MEIIVGLVLLGLALLVMACIRSRSRKRQSPEEMTSLILLLPQPRPLTEADIRAAVTRACGVHFTPDDENATVFVLEMPDAPTLVGDGGHTYMLKIPQGVFLLHNAAIPYAQIQDEQVIAQVREERLRRVLREHRAWLSVDLLKSSTDDRPATAAYPTIGAILAEFADEACLGVACPALQKCRDFLPSLLPVLRSDHPLAIFEQLTNAPVVAMDADDPALAAAIAEARQRWPEFVAAFHARPDGDEQFSIKAPISDGDVTEHLWVMPVAITDATITGTLGNDPCELPRLKLGDTVTVPVAQVSDWMYFQGENLIGGFSLELLENSLRSQ